jgi:hypothetical protein
MTRINFEVSEKRLEELDDLKNQLGIKTRVSLFNAALTLFQWAVRERMRGRVIASVDERNDSYKEVEIPEFPPVATPEPELQDILELLYGKMTKSEKEQFIIFAKTLDQEGVDKNQIQEWEEEAKDKDTFEAQIGDKTYTTRVRMNIQEDVDLDSL